MLATIGGMFAWQKIQSEKDLDSNWWNIEYKEITFPRSKAKSRTTTSASMFTISDDGQSIVNGHTGGQSGKSSAMRANTQQSMATSLVSAAGQFDSVLVGLFRGIKIAYKPLEIKRITINRKMLFEFRQV